MPRRDLSKLSATEDPYTLLKYPAAFQIALSDGKAVHNARQIAHFSKKAGLPHYQNMYREKLSPEKTKELQRTLGFVEHDGRMMTKRHAGKLRKVAKRELLQREGKSFVGPLMPRAPVKQQRPRSLQEQRYANYLAQRKAELEQRLAELETLPQRQRRRSSIQNEIGMIRQQLSMQLSMIDALA
jgi:hypothetical protein